MENLEQAYDQQKLNEETIANMQFAQELAGDKLEDKPPIQPVNEEGKDTSVIKDIGRGILEIPTQTTGGVIDGLFNDTSELAYDMANWLTENVGDLGQLKIDENGVSWQEGMPEENTLQVPTTPKAETKTGEIVREMSNFIALFPSHDLRFDSGLFTKSAIKPFIKSFEIRAEAASPCTAFSPLNLPAPTIVTGKQARVKP